MKKQVFYFPDGSIATADLAGGVEIEHYVVNNETGERQVPQKRNVSEKEYKEKTSDIIKHKGDSMKKSNIDKEKK